MSVKRYTPLAFNNIRKMKRLISRFLLCVMVAMTTVVVRAEDEQGNQTFFIELDIDFV